jgi:hypothetical protein
MNWTACQVIQAKPGISERECPSAQLRAGSHVDMHGNHIEHVL